MAIIDGADFEPKWPYTNAHYNTFVPYLFGNAPVIRYSRERFELPDGDFLDLDAAKIGARQVAILCHGLEGSAESGYVREFAQFFNSKDWDVVSPNYRGCSGEMNRSLTMYNSGTTGDIDYVIRQVASDYDRIVLVGFSLGGNLVLKYLGEDQFSISEKIICALAISTPVHLADSSRQLLKAQNYAYQIKFLYSLISKIRQKKRQFPDDISLKPLLKIRNLYHFDDYYTAPIFGYKDADDYYAKNQSLQFLSGIKTPSLIINAIDDPFLGDLCYPFEQTKKSEVVSLCAPKFGGHVGFARSRTDRSWIKEKVWSFIEHQMV